MSKEWHYYRVYGLTLKSDIVLSEFVEIDNKSNVDVYISFKQFPLEIKNKINMGLDYEADSNEIWFNIKNIGTYHVKDGKYIYYEPKDEKNSYYLKIFITCSCLGFLMIQRNKLAIHGGTIVINGEAVIITGDKGAGKSTLCSSLRQKGYKFLADDIAAIDFNEDPVVCPGYPYQKLCDDVYFRMGYKDNEYFSFMSDKKIKYVVPVNEDFVTDCVNVSCIFKLSVGQIPDVQIHEIKGAEKLSMIIENIYRGEFIKIFGGMKSEYFKKCFKLASKVKFFEIIRPIDGFFTEEQIKIIEQCIKDKPVYV